MGTEVSDVRRGFYSLLRWVPDVARDEPRNVAVLFVDPDSDAVAVRAAPISSLTPSLRDQGLLDRLVMNLQQRLLSDSQHALKILQELHETLERSLIVTAPESVAVVDTPEVVVRSLYRAFLASRPVPHSLTKGVVLDHTVDVLRSQGHTVLRGEERGRFIFDAIVQDRRETALSVLSFAVGRKDWSPVFHDAGHFLYALEHVPRIRGTGVVQAPGERAPEDATAAYKRVIAWFSEAQVSVIAPSDLEGGQLSFLGNGRRK